MRVIKQRVFVAVSAVLFCRLLSPDAGADPLYSVTDLGPASPSAAYLSGQWQLDPRGDYLPLLSPSQQAAFQAGSFDVYAHPVTAATTAASGFTFYVSAGGDVVNTFPSNDPIEITYPYLITSNNVGESAGSGTEVYPMQNFYKANEFVTFTSDPHTVTYTTDPQTGGTATAQSPGYLSVVWTIQATNPGGTGGSAGQVAGINDHGNIALSEGYAGPSYPAVITPHLYNSADATDVSLGSLGGAAGIANALNNSNEVVGWSQIASGAQHAFLYSNGSMQDLNLLIPPLSGITLVSAVGIDSAGDIVAYGSNAVGQMNEYYLSPMEVPAPEPSTLAVMSMMIVAVTARVAYMRSRNR